MAEEKKSWVPYTDKQMTLDEIYQELGDLNKDGKEEWWESLAHPAPIRQGNALFWKAVNWFCAPEPEPPKKQEQKQEDVPDTPNLGNIGGPTAQEKDRAALVQEVKGMFASYEKAAIDKATDNAEFTNKIDTLLVQMGYINPMLENGETIGKEGFKKFCEETGNKLTAENGKVVLNDQNKETITQGIIQARMPMILKTLGYTKDNISVKDVYNSDAFKKFCDETGFNKDNISIENLKNTLDTWEKQNPQASTAQKPKGAEMKKTVAGATVTEHQLSNGQTIAFYKAKADRGGMGA